MIGYRDLDRRDDGMNRRDLLKLGGSVLGSAVLKPLLPAALSAPEPEPQADDLIGLMQEALRQIEGSRNTRPGLVYYRALDESCDWLEDFEHENGSYLNHCSACHAVFLGHKRRVVCRQCARPTLAVAAS